MTSPELDYVGSVDGRAMQVPPCCGGTAGRNGTEGPTRTNSCATVHKSVTEPRIRTGRFRGWRTCESAGASIVIDGSKSGGSTGMAGGFDVELVSASADPGPRDCFERRRSLRHLTPVDVTFPVPSSRVAGEPINAATRRTENPIFPVCYSALRMRRATPVWPAVQQQPSLAF